MLNKKVLALTLSFIAISQYQSLAIEITKDVYAKVGGKIGYNAQFYQGDIKIISDKNKVAHAVNISAQADFFYKATNVIHPFAGIEIGGNYNINNEFVKDNKFNQYLNVNFRLGSSFKINKDLSIRPYGLVGFNVSENKNPDNNNISSDEIHKTKIDSRELALSAIKEMEIRNLLDEYIKVIKEGGWLEGRTGFKKFSGSYKEGGYDLNHGVYIYINKDYDYVANQIRAGTGSFDEDWIGSAKLQDGDSVYYYINFGTIELSGTRDEALINELIGKEFIFAEPSSFYKITNKQAMLIDSINGGKPIKIGLNAGAGVDFVIKERYVIGLEYRYSQVKFDYLKAQTHNIGIRFGVEF